MKTNDPYWWVYNDGVNALRLYIIKGFIDLESMTISLLPVPCSVLDLELVHLFEGPSYH